MKIIVDGGWIIEEEVFHEMIEISGIDAFVQQYEQQIQEKMIG